MYGMNSSILKFVWSAICFSSVVRCISRSVTVSLNSLDAKNADAVKKIFLKSEKKPILYERINEAFNKYDGDDNGNFEDIMEEFDYSEDKRLKEIFKKHKASHNWLDVEMVKFTNCAISHDVNAEEIARKKRSESNDICKINFFNPRELRVLFEGLHDIVKLKNEGDAQYEDLFVTGTRNELYAAFANALLYCNMKKMDNSKERTMQIYTKVVNYSLILMTVYITKHKVLTWIIASGSYSIFNALKTLPLYSYKKAMRLLFKHILYKSFGKKELHYLAAVKVALESKLKYCHKDLVYFTKIWCIITHKAFLDAYDDVFEKGTWFGRWLRRMLPGRSRFRGSSFGGRGLNRSVNRMKKSISQYSDEEDD